MSCANRRVTVRQLLGLGLMAGLILTLPACYQQEAPKRAGSADGAAGEAHRAPGATHPMAPPAPPPVDLPPDAAKDKEKAKETEPTTNEDYARIVDNPFQVVTREPLS